MTSLAALDRPGIDRSQLLRGELAAKLGVSPAVVDPDRGFDSYGLDSIDAVIVGSAVGAKMGVELPPELFLQHRTLNEVLAALNAAHPPAGVEGVEPRSARRCVYLCPGGWGHGYRNKEFAAQVAFACELQHVTIGGWRDWIDDGLQFEVLIAEVCRQIEAASPDGPLRLAGYSQGGLLAFGAAVALQRAGRSVSSLSLFDSETEVVRHETPDPPWRTASKLAGAFGRALLFHASRRFGRFAYAGATPGETRCRAFYLARRLANRRARLWPILLRRLSRSGGWSFRGRGGVALEKAVRLQLFSDMWASWREAGPRRLDGGGARLFRSEQAGSADRGWAELCRELEIVPIRGQHATIFDEENVESLSQSFIASLALATPSR